MPAVAVADPRRRRACIPCLRAGPARRPPGRRARTGTARGARAAVNSREPSRSDVAPSGLALPSAAAASGTAARGVWGRPGRGWGRGSAGARRDGGRRARGWAGVDTQHLGRNSSRRFPPSSSQGPEIGPCEAEGGSERRVCVRARRADDGGFFLRPRKRAERIIKAGKRSWAQRGGAWGGGCTSPGSCYTALGAASPGAFAPSPKPLGTGTFRDARVAGSAPRRCL